MACKFFSAKRIDDTGDAVRFGAYFRLSDQIFFKKKDAGVEIGPSPATSARFLHIIAEL